MKSYLMNSSNKERVYQFICEQRKYEYNVETYTAQILNQILDNDQYYACVAEVNDEIKGVVFVVFYEGRQMWSRGELLGSIEQITIDMCGKYEEISRELYMMAQKLLAQKNGLKLSINDFSSPAFFEANGLNSEECMLRSYL